jgi:hypothetical protein
MNFKLLLILSFFISQGISARADFDMSPYQQPEPTIASMSSEFFYPPYFRETDLLTFRNIRHEIRFRFDFVAGVRPEPRYMYCFKMQKRIVKALERYRTAGAKPNIRRLDDNLLFNPDSPLQEYLRPMPVPPTHRCSYRSAGDLAGEGVVYCVYHGPVQDSELYRKYESRFLAEKPFFTAFDVVEILIFFPVLIVLPVTWLIMRKVLDKGR